jgi:hypothetical protein
MKVRIDTKNWMGNYNSTIKTFNSEGHLSNYIRFMGHHEIYSKIIGVEILTN